MVVGHCLVYIQFLTIFVKCKTVRGLVSSGPFYTNSSTSTPWNKYWLGSFVRYISTEHIVLRHYQRRYGRVYGFLDDL